MILFFFHPGRENRILANIMCLFSFFSHIFLHFFLRSLFLFFIIFCLSDVVAEWLERAKRLVLLHNHIIYFQNTQYLLSLYCTYTIQYGCLKWICNAWSIVYNTYKYVRVVKLCFVYVFKLCSVPLFFLTQIHSHKQF